MDNLLEQSNARAAASPSSRPFIQTQIAAGAKKTSDAGTAVVTAQNAAADADKAADDHDAQNLCRFNLLKFLVHSWKIVDTSIYNNVAYGKVLKR